MAIEIRNKYFGSAEILSVPITNQLAVGHCYTNVQDWVSRNGGSSVYGWLLSVWPGQFVEATHHAVWRTPDGDLEDITAHAYPAMTGEFSTFIIDPHTRIRTGGEEPVVLTKYLQLSELKETTEFIHSMRTAIRAKEEFHEYVTSFPIIRHENGRPVRRIPNTHKRQYDVNNSKMVNKDRQANDARIRLIAACK
ncbi:hypothetical protein [Massilia sp.]|uniref:hypothetical protein n=1 Tax=Massilia sp. TaxID=1882437 RepID=UPI00352C22CF